MRPYIVILAASISFSASALQIGDFFQNAEVIKANSVKVVNDSLIRVSTTIKGYAANAPYAIKTVDVPKASFMSHVKGNMKSLAKRNAWYAAWLGTMAVAGWAIDELTGQVVAKKPDYFLGYYHYAFVNGYGPVPNSAASTPDEACALSASFGGFTSSIYSASPNPHCKNYKGDVYQGTYNVAKAACTVYQSNVESCKGVSAPVVPVPDPALYQSLTAEMLKDPKAAAQAFMVPDAWPYPYPHIFPDPVKYIPGVSETDEALLDSLIKGQLQTTNPNAANYVTPEKLQQLQTMLSQLQQGLTPEGQAGIANDNLKQPITQAQLEETLKKQKEAEAKADQEAATKAQEALAPAEATLDKLNEEKQWFEEAIKDSVNQAPPSQGISLPKWTWPVGSCKPFPITFSISNLSAKANDGGAFCDNYNNTYHPLIYWFLYMLLALYLFVLWNRTMVQVLGSR